MLIRTPFGKIYNIPVAGDPIYENSVSSGFDYFYTPPIYVENFIQHLQKELPEGYIAKLWSIPRLVTVWGPQGRIYTISYELIEDDIVSALDRTIDHVRQLN